MWKTRVFATFDQVPLGTLVKFAPKKKKGGGGRTYIARLTTLYYAKMGCGFGGLVTDLVSGLVRNLARELVRRKGFGKRSGEGSGEGSREGSCERSRKVQ
jgi:uncharacterized membrane protein